MIIEFEQKVSNLTGGSATMGVEGFLLAQAKNESIEKGKLEEARAIAREMKKDGSPFTQIAKFTKLSIEEIEKL